MWKPYVDLDEHDWTLQVFFKAHMKSSINPNQIDPTLSCQPLGALGNTWEQTHRSN
jgi:hypothetical protein